MKTEMTIRKREEQAVFALRELYLHYGYLPYKMSRFEEYDLYVRNKDFLASEQIITFADRSGKLLALKPDVTLSIIKNAQDFPGSVQKLYYNESVYRADAASHTLKEIMQAGLECVGDLGSYEIAEVVLLAAKSLALLGDRFVLDISHMGLIHAVLDSCMIPAENEKAIMLCLRQKNAHELIALCGEITPENEDKLRKLVTLSGNAQQILSQLEPVLTTDAEHTTFAELQALCTLLAKSGYGDMIRVDFSVGNNMKYYNGVVFKGYLEGMPSSILSGGQYDKLLQKMGKTSRAIGFALYLSMLERQNEHAGLFDVDTLIVHDGNTEPSVLVALAEEATKNGSVLVAAEIPDNRKYRRLVRVVNGEVVSIEHG